MLLDSQHVEFFPKLAKYSQICEKCMKSVWCWVNDCLKVCKGITNDFPSSSTCFKNVVFYQKLAKINQSVWNVCKEFVRMCEEVCESLQKNHQWVSHLEYILFNTQHVEFGPKLAKMPKVYENCVKSVWYCVKWCVKVCESIDTEFFSSSTCF